MNENWNDPNQREAGIAAKWAACEDNLTRLTAERDALRADAERYRWLREQQGFLECATFTIKGEFNPMTGFFDTIIDEARSKT